MDEERRRQAAEAAALAQQNQQGQQNQNQQDAFQVPPAENVQNNAAEEEENMEDDLQDEDVQDDNLNQNQDQGNQNNANPNNAHDQEPEPNQGNAQGAQGAGQGQPRARQRLLRPEYRAEDNPTANHPDVHESLVGLTNIVAKLSLNIEDAMTPGGANAQQRAEMAQTLAQVAPVLNRIKCEAKLGHTRAATVHEIPTLTQIPPVRACGGVASSKYVLCAKFWIFRRPEKPYEVSGVP